MENENMTYLDSGVDMDEGEKAVCLMNEFIEPTLSKSVLSHFGMFAGLFQLGSDHDQSVLVASTDGVGTKLKIASMMDNHDTIGIDLVAMCVNDVLCHGAKPLFLLNYISSSDMDAGRISNIVKGIAKGCEHSKISLIGGETAQMPGFYRDGDYDIAGFAVGIVKRDKIVDGSCIAKGDVLIGLPSSGMHSNGYSLVRKLLFERLDYEAGTYIEQLGSTLGGALLTPTRIYTRPVLKAIEDVKIKGMCHITGGGLIGNIPRILPKGLGAVIDPRSWDMPLIFKFIMGLNEIDIDEMYRVFNMGIGYVFVVSCDDADRLIMVLEGVGEKPILIGRVTDESTGVTICL